MRVQYQTNIQKQPNFQNKYIKKITEVIDNPKVSKNLTHLDGISMQAYISSKPYKMNVTQEEISALKKFEGVEFILNSYEFLCSKLGLSEKTRPQFQVLQSMAGELKMGYFHINNVIVCDYNKVCNARKDDIYALIRHELQHFLQNASALRHETLGQETIDAMVNKFTQEEKKSVINILANYSDKQIATFFSARPDTLAIYIKARKFLESGNQKEFDKLMENNSLIYRQEMLNIQNQLKKELGEIPADSPLTDKIKKDFDEMMTICYSDENGTLDAAKYFASGIEQDAMDAQNAAVIDFSQSECGFKTMKEATLSALELEYEFIDRAMSGK